MTSGSRWFRRAEIALWVLGISLLGGSLSATLHRWNYQAEQERVLFRTATKSVSPTVLSETLLSETRDGGPIGPPAPVGPPTPAIDEQPDVKPAPAREERKSARDQPAEDPTALGRIEIPRIGVTAIIREGADADTLARAVGLVPGAARPGELGNTVLAGHRDTFFRPLRRIRVDDRIRVLVPPNAYEYRVDSLRVVSPEETSVLHSNGYEALTLITCYPFRFIGPAPERFVVSATRVN